MNPHPLAVSSVVAADSLPWLLLALPAGAFADRFDGARSWPSRTSSAPSPSSSARCSVLNDRMNLFLLIVVVLINAAARAIYYSSLQAIVPELVHTDGLSTPTVS